MKKTKLILLSLCLALLLSAFGTNFVCAASNDVINETENGSVSETTADSESEKIPETRFGRLENGEIRWETAGSAGEAALRSYTDFICDSCSVLKGATGSLVTTTTVPAWVTVSWSSLNTNIATVNSSGTVTGVNAGIARINASVTDGSGTTVKQVTVYVTMEDGIYYIKNNGTSQYLNVLSNNFSAVNVASKETADPARLYQLWKIKYLGSGCYSIRPLMKLDMCFGRYGTSVANVTVGTTDTLTGLSGLYQWKLEGNSSGYKFNPVSYTDQYMSVSGTTISLGGTSNTVWNLEKLASPPTGVFLGNTKSWMAPGSTAAFTASAYQGSLINQTFTWTSSNTSVATVSSTGTVTAVSAGTTTIRATSTVYSSLFGSFVLNVSEIANGTYFINSKASPDKTVDIYQHSSSSGAYIHQLAFDGTDAQRWVFELQSDGYYTIKNVFSDKYLSVKDNSTSNGAEIVQYDSATANGQKWKVIKTSSGAFKLRSKVAGNTDLCLMKGTSSSYPDRLVHKLYTNNSTYDDEWNLFSVDNENKIYLLGITNALHDHITCLKNVGISLLNAGYTNINIKSGTISATDCKAKLISNNVFTSRSHGIVVQNSGTNSVVANGIVLNDSSSYIAFFNQYFEGIDARHSYINSTDSFANEKLVLFIGCSTAMGGESGENLTSSIVEKGCCTAIGFSDSINCSLANVWTEKFYEYLLHGYSVINAAQSASNVSGLNSVVICGNKYLTIYDIMED